MKMTCHLHNQLTDGWTQERRQRQSELIQTWQPWASSTGPKTTEGKAKAAQNAFKGGIRPLLRRIAKALNRSQQTQDDLSTEDYDSMADKVVAAALDGESWAIQELARALDE